MTFVAFVERLRCKIEPSLEEREEREESPTTIISETRVTVTLPLLQVLLSLLDRLVLEGAINQWIYERIGHAEEEDSGLKVLAEPLIWIGEHEYEHHRVVGRPADDERCDYHHRDPQRLHLRLVYQLLSVRVTATDVIRLDCRL